MKHNAPQNRTTRRILPIACATALAVAFTLSLPQPAHADEVTPPAVPDGLEVEAGNVAFLVGHANGTQNYVCLPTASGFAWTLFTPEATLFDDRGRQIITHFFSPNPFEVNTNPRVVAAGPIRATWQHSRDTSSVWAFVEPVAPGQPAHSSTDEKFVAKGAVAWLLLKVVGTQAGPGGGDILAHTTFVQRLSTSGGIAPSTGCSALADVGKLAFKHYTADYFFYRNSDSD